MIIFICRFPSEVLALGQMFATIFILGFGKLLNIVDYPSLSMDTVYKVTPKAVMGRPGLLIRTAKIVLSSHTAIFQSRPGDGHHHRVGFHKLYTSRWCTLLDGNIHNLPC